MARVDNRGNLRGSLQNRVRPNELSTRGADDFYKLSKALKAAGQTELRKELHKAVRDAAKPLVPKVRQAAREKLPTTGGLNERIAKKPYRAQARTGVKTAGVRITGSKVDPRINDQGRVGHPVFGRKGKAKNGGKNFVVQTVPTAKGYFDETLSREGPAVREAVVRTMSDFTDRIVREAKG
jgi:hypothetical protein